MSSVASESPFLVRNFRNEGKKFEIRISKSETNPNIEILNPNKVLGFLLLISTHPSSLIPHAYWFSSSDFEFVSDFDIRISDLTHPSSLIPHAY